MSGSLAVLVVATKSPWPPVDGGRLVLLETLRALTMAGHRAVLVAPCDPALEDPARATAVLRACCEPYLVPCATQARAVSVARALRDRTPVTIARHTRPEVAAQVARLLEGRSFDVVHAEQAQSLPQVAAARRAGVPVVVRTHNVESRLWDFSAAHRGLLLRTAFRLEARRMARWEGGVLAATDLVLALSEIDLEPLARAVAGAVEVLRVSAPFARDLPPGLPLGDGHPTVSLLASGAWLPARDAARRFAEIWWPAVRQLTPAAQLHVFGAMGSPPALDGVTWHGPPADSATAFPRGGIAVVPVRHPTGVPMKGLEAWARGLPVIASPDAARALEAEDDRELLVARDPEALARAVLRLGTEAALRDRLVSAARARLTSTHAPPVVAAQLAEAYERAAAGRAARARR